MKLIAIILKLVYLSTSCLPEVPTLSLSLDTFDDILDIIVACRYFLPLDTICQLTGATVSLFALRALVALLSTSIGKLLLGLFGE